MKALRQLAGVTALLAAAVLPAAAGPSLDAPRPMGSLVVYPDDQRPGLFYYGPGELAVVTDADGRPDLHFLQARYTGSAVTADRGRLVYNSILSFRVALRPPSVPDLEAARRTLSARGAPVELRALPIRRLEADLVYAPVGAVEEAGTDLPPGHFEEDASAARRPGVFWTTRSYALGLDPASSELFWAALMKGQTALSVSYAFHASDGAVPTPADHVVRAGAFAVTVDAKRWPELFRRVDVGERVPPDYPLLDVYCYDFQDAGHPGLYEKEVEVQAEGVGGGPVTTRLRFARDQPDLYARSIRFGFAVRLDRPYRYRVTRVADDGQSTAGPWAVRTSWNELLDVTTPRETGPARDGLTGGER